MAKPDTENYATATIRVDVSKPPQVEILVLDTLSVITPMGRMRCTYSTTDSLPEWLQRKLSVLMGFKHEIPTEPVQGVGRRVSQNVYWVFLDPGETLGTNTRAKSKKRGARSS